MRKKILALAIAILCLTTFVFAKDGVVPKVNKTLPFHKGVNLSNRLEGHGNSNVRSQFFVKQDFIDIKNLGADIVRIPIFFEEFSSGSPDYIVEKWLWKKIDSAIEWCEDLDLYMIIDFHNDCSGWTKRDQMLKKCS